MLFSAVSAFVSLCPVFFESSGIQRPTRWPATRTKSKRVSCRLHLELGLERLTALLSVTDRLVLLIVLLIRRLKIAIVSGLVPGLDLRLVGAGHAAGLRGNDLALGPGVRILVQ